MQILGKLALVDHFLSDKSGKHYTTVFELATGSQLKLTSDQKLEMEPGIEYDAQLNVRVRPGQGGGQFVEILPGSKIGRGAKS